MRFQELFTIPAGKKVTEKDLHRVLFASICSILLCMTCLVSTTWAWFTVSIENTGNTIEIATITASVAVTNQERTAVAASGDGSYVLNAGEYNICIALEDETSADAKLLNNSKPTVYVVMTVSGGDTIEYRLLTFEKREAAQNCQLTVIGDAQAMVSFSVSWVEPASETADGSEPVVIGTVESETEPTGETSEPTEETTEPTEGATDSTEETTESTEETTIPDETSTPTEPSSAGEEPPASTTIPTETTEQN